MYPQPLFCLNLACPSRGLQNAGNIGLHAGLHNRWICHTCGTTFVTTKGTLFYKLKTDPKIVVWVLVLLAFGCPLQAIVAAFGLDERTVKSWQNKAGKHCQEIHTHLVTKQPMDLGQVQADEVRVRLQKRLVVWMAMAICVPTRLWLGGVLSPVRDKHLIHKLAQRVKACACFGPILLLTDGLKSYVSAWQKAFRTPLHTGKRGQPRLNFALTAQAPTLRVA